MDELDKLIQDADNQLNKSASIKAPPQPLKYKVGDYVKIRRLKSDEPLPLGWVDNMRGLGGSILPIIMINQVNSIFTLRGGYMIAESEIECKVYVEQPVEIPDAKHIMYPETVASLTKVRGYELPRNRQHDNLIVLGII